MSEEPVEALAEPVAEFISAVSVSLRRLLYRHLKDKGLSQDAVTQLVAKATKQALVTTGLTDLAVCAHAAADVVAALEEIDPEHEALTGFETVRGGVSGGVGNLYRLVMTP